LTEYGKGDAMFHPGGTPINQALWASVNPAIAPISYFEPLRPPISGWRGSVKRLTDIAIALLLLAVVSPAMLVAVVAIRLESPGPVLFRQRRIGFGNIGFDMLKFRTMQHRAPDRGRLRQTTRCDPRVTRVGAIMRRASFDELPQLFNVLRGDMSIVGPRPHAPGTCAGGKPFELITPCYAARHRVLPGMTGLAQVRGLRGETETEEKLLRRVEADLEYIDNWSLWLDLAIMARTTVSVFAMRNAY
jgi:lipopolysaccharide/colanic/teichoic acid biosynthesis glycosyltransferase